MQFLRYLLGLGAIAALAVAASTASADHARDVQTYTADLQAITTNDSDANGTATLTLRGNMLTVEIDATGVEEGETHPQHIHGFGKGEGKKRNATCPTAEQDDDGDGLVSVAEGRETYGQILLPLTPFPTADDGGSYRFEETYKIKRGQLTPLENRHIVLHGKDVDGEYRATLPVACGQIEKTG